MVKISEMIIEPGTEHRSIEKTRITVRCIYIKNGKILMNYSPVLNDFTFPGGGIKPGENHMEALKRELKEELGALELSEIHPYGYIEEKRFGINGSDTVYLQTSYYYFLRIDRFGEQNLVENELKYGLIPTWVSCDEAIAKNQQIIDEQGRHKGMSTVLPRENSVLKSIKEHLNEKI